MGAAAAIGPAISIMGAGLSAFSGIEKASGQKQADEYQAEHLDRAAEYGRLKATQTSAQMTQRLNQTLGNIDVIRAAAHTDPTSPTGAAYRDYQEGIGETQRTITVQNILAQSQQQESDAAYLRSAGNSALLAGEIGAGGSLLGSIGGAVGRSSFGLPGGGGSTPDSSNPTKAGSLY